MKSKFLGHGKAGRGLAEANLPRTLLGLLAHFGCALFLLVASSTAFAQDITGNLYGNIQDASHALIPHSKITIIDREHGSTRTVESDAQGGYLASQLPVGKYQVTVTVAGFEKSVRNNVTVNAGANTHLDVVMVAGSVSDSVTVNVEDNTVDTRGYTVGTLIDNVSLQELPLDGNNIIGLAALLPGVTSVTAPPSFTGDHSGPTFSASGSRVTQNLFLFDGVLYNNLYRNTGLNYPPRDAVQEVQVLTNNYSAEYGRNSGSVFQVVTKSGSNQFHLALWENAKNAAFNATNWALRTVQPLVQNQFGGTVSGPILKNKFFYEATYQGFRLINTSTTGSPIFVSAPYITSSRPAEYINETTDANIYGQIYDPKTGNAFPTKVVNGSTASVIPYSRFDPTAVALIKAFNLSVANGVATTTIKLPQKNDLGIIRADYRFARHDVDFRYYVLDSTAVTGSGTIFNYEAQNSDAHSMLSSATDTWVLSPNMINVAHAGYKRFVTYILPSDTRSLADFGANVPTIGPPALPYISVSSAFLLSSGNTVYNQFVNQNAEINDSITYTHGTHTFKAGLTYLHLQFLERSFNSSQGLFTFSGQESVKPGTTAIGAGNPLADFLLGAPAQFTIASPQLEDSGIENVMFAYVQDQWRVTPSLTLNIGLRYELPFPWTAQKGYGGTFSYGQQSTVFPNAPAGLVFVGDKGVPPGVVPTDANNFAPRFGFAWSPLRSGKLSVRGGYGIAFDAINANVLFVGQPFRYTYNIGSPYSFTDPLHGQPPVPTTINLNNPTFLGLPTVSFADPNLRSPYIEQMNFGFQYALPLKAVFEANYVSKIGHKLVLPYTYNPALYGPGATLANQDSRRRIQGFGDLEDFSTRGWSNYNALQVGITRRVNSFTLNAAYTWSRSLDVGSASDVEGGYLPTPFHLRDNYGPSDFNATHVLSVGYVVKLPTLRKHNQFLQQVFGSWLYSGIYGIRSGSPVNVTIGADNALSTTPNQRPNVSGDWRLSTSRSRSDRMLHYFNPDAFSYPTIGTYGNASRNLVTGPTFYTNNMALSKGFPIPKMRPGTRLEFRCDAFGVFNTPNFGAFNSTALQLGSSLGRIYSTTSERTLQLSLHLNY
jgi:hypothetical protein